MAQSSIEWTEKVWNPTTGCNKVSQGCKNCYAEKMHKRLRGMGQEKYQRDFLAGAFPHEPSLSQPLSWKKGVNVFVNSMSDLWHEDLPIEFIAQVYAIMFLCEQHTFQVLTKRPQRRAEILNTEQFTRLIWQYANMLHDKYIKKLEQELYFYDEIKNCLPLNNVWEGTSVENQATAEERIPELMATPAAVRWLSMEPLLEAVDLSRIPEALYMNWIVIGGESGPKKRPFNTDWARTIRDFCRDNHIPFFMKQIDKVQEIPSTLMIREYPTIK